MFISLIWVGFYAFKPNLRDSIYILFFNPLWPIILGWFEFVIQENDREISSENKKKLDSLNGVIRKSLDTAQDKERLLVEAIVDAVGAGDLASINEDRIKQQKLKQKVDETKVEQTKPEDLTP